MQRHEWKARICPDFEQGAVWHPDLENVVFFPGDGECYARSKTKKRLGVGEESASLVAADTEDGKILNVFSEEFTEKNFGIVTSPTKPYICFPNGCGKGSVCIMRNSC